MTSHHSRWLPSRNPRFGHFLAATTVSLVGTNVFDIAMPLYVLHRTGSVIDLSLVSVALQLPYVLTAPLMGYLADHSSKRRSLMLADLGQVFFLFLLSAYLYSGAAPLWPILGLVFAVKSLMLLFETISQFQMIPALSGPGELTSGNTWYLSLHRTIQIIGPLLGGALVYFWGIQSCIWVNIISFAATLHFTWSFRKLDLLLSHKKGGVSESLSLAAVTRKFQESLRFIWASPVFHPFIVLMFLWNLSSFTLNSPALTYYFTAAHQFTAAQYGLIVSVFGVLGIFGFMASPRLYRTRPFENAFVGSALWQAVLGSVCLLPFGMPLWVGALYGLSRAASSALSLGSYIIRQTRVPPEHNGAINASLRMFFMAAAPLSSFLQGWIIRASALSTRG
ncbi:MFS transporter [bacterium]|nr:MFS transporter [bacterium]